jgi:hypothetical protein
VLTPFVKVAIRVIELQNLLTTQPMQEAVDFNELEVVRKLTRAELGSLTQALAAEVSKDAKLLKARPARRCSPRHSTRFEPSYLETRGFL